MNKKYRVMVHNGLGTTLLGNDFTQLEVQALCEYCCHRWRGIPDANCPIVVVGDFAVTEAQINPATTPSFIRITLPYNELVFGRE